MGFSPSDLGSLSVLVKVFRFYLSISPSLKSAKSIILQLPSALPSTFGYFYWHQAIAQPGRKVSAFNLRQLLSSIWRVLAVHAWEGSLSLSSFGCCNRGTSKDQTFSAVSGARFFRRLASLRPGGSRG